jgi:hypothetical protein
VGGEAQPVRIAIPSLPAVDLLLRPLDGATEAAVVPERPGAATTLVETLASHADGSPLDIRALPVSVHDRLLAAIYEAGFGDQVSCQAFCSACGEAFRFSFALSALIESQDRAAEAAGALAADGSWTTPEGARLRPPTLDDGGDGDAAALLSRLAAEPVTEDRAEALGAFLESASPLLSLDLETLCPECSAPQKVWFDLARFLLRAIAAERPFLIRETHLIAARYGWSHQEIMALPRADRRAYATLIESERSASLRLAS